MSRSDGKSESKSTRRNGVNSEDNAAGGDGGGITEVVILEETVEGHTCRACQGPDTEEMVQCDVCDRWHHFSCVGVSEEVADKSWSCTNCVTAKWVQRTKAASDGAPIKEDVIQNRRSLQDLSIGKIVTSTRGNPVIPSATTSQKSAKSLTVPLASHHPAPLVPVPDQKQQTSTHSIDIPLIGSGIRSDPASQKYLKSLPVSLASKHQTCPDLGFSQQKQKSSLPAVVLPVIDAEEAISEMSISSSQKSATNRAKLQLMRLQEERAFQQQQEERRRISEEKAAQEYKEYLDNKYKILEDLASERGSSRSSNFSRRRVEEWVQATNPTPLDTAKTAAQEQDGLQEQQQQEHRRQEFVEQQQQERLRQEQLREKQQQQEATLQEQHQQQRLHADQLRKQQQKQLEREQQFRQYQQQQRQEQIRQESLLRQQQEDLRKEADAINRMWEQQLEQERILRDQQQQLADGQGVMRRPGNLIHCNQMPEPQLNPPPVNLEAESCRESIREQPGQFLPDALPQSTQLHPRESYYPHRPSMNTGDRNRGPSVNSSIVDDDDQFQLSRSQVAARQAVSKDLPTFSGNPEEWPVFISMYNRTTTMCGFTEDENIVRLQKSLKGRAYDAVKSRLMHSGNVPGILSTLKMLFGQPEVIIQSLIGKVSFLSSIREDKLETLVDFAVNVQNFSATVDACGLHEYMYNVTLLHQLVGKLPPSLKLNWAQHRRTLSLVNLATFSDWIHALAEAASVVVFPPAIHDGKPTQNEAWRTKKRNAYLNAHSETFRSKDYSSDSEEQTTVASTSAKESCQICKGTCKSADKCKRFLELSRESRWAVIREFEFCRTCLRIHKGYSKAKPCGKDGCTYRHHELLHNNSKENPKNTGSTTEGEQSSQSSTSKSGCNTHQTTVSSVLFRYLPVVLYGKNTAICTYAFLDEGSALTLLDQELANELQLDGTVSPLCLRWTGGTERHEADSHIYNLHIAGGKNESKKFLLSDVRTVKELLLPQKTMDMAKLSQLYPHLRNLPIDSYRDARPRILIGMKHALLSLGLKNREGEIGQPIAVKTRLGWTVCGGWTSQNEASLHHYTFHVCPCSVKSDEDLHQAMKDYFSIDSLGLVKSEKALLSVEDERAVSLLQSLTRRKDDRYESGLLWRFDDARLPDSRSMALWRFQCLKKRMEKDPQLSNTLQAKIAKYVEKQYIRKLTDEEINQKVPRRCTAQLVKNTHAERFASKYPAACEAITKSHYVDDMLVSVDTEEQAIQLAKDVKHVHEQGGFEIRNWVSNSRKVLESLQEADTDKKCLDLSPELATEKVLGMWWNTSYDVFTYKVGWSRYDSALLGGQRRPTKREVLHPAPANLAVRCAWDEEIDDNAYEKWNTWLQVLPRVEQIQIPRCYNSKYPAEEADDIQLHTMVDASENGMAAVCYLRFVKTGTIICSIVAAKPRVAPLKFTSIPRMELAAAVLGARLAHAVERSLSIHIFRKVYWSDSRDVLCWINLDHRHYSQYVGNRISEIVEISETHEWRWVPRKLNCADDATKWSRLPDMSSNHRWYKGADFLWRAEEDWPPSPTLSGSTENELRPSFLAHHELSEPVISVSNYSSWKRLVKVAALVHRFASNCRLKHARRPILTGTLTANDLLSAECLLIRLAQRETYPDEIAVLQKASRCPDSCTSTIPKTSSLYPLTPWLDDHGIMRMQTRIAACQYATDDAKHPIILHRNHHTTTLIVAYYHHKYHHQNHETVINEIRQKFRNPHLRTCYERVRKTCQWCKNQHAAPSPPYMADLPPARLAAFSRPFTYVGVDYFGPIEVVVGRRVEKRWGMLATCLTVRAIHIEVVHSLCTSSCIMAIHNFIARRGTPQKIYSDRGTNFIGANRELKQANEAVHQHELMKEFTSSGIEWVFNPPLSPHMGGSWERLIRTVKNNLMVVCSSKRPSDEVLRNLLIEVQNTVNSLPLTHVPIDEDSAPALTPNHFLLGSSNGSKPLVNFDDTGAILRQNWCTSQILANQYWKRWVSDYLPEITRRTKWFRRVKPIAVGDIVVIADSNMPRNCWPKGKVVGIKVSQDDQVRSATVRTVSGIYDRPATKLAVLDVRCDGE
ncbi:uncharacterized protein LOC135715349 [Ochlerotatus camptorhynchus]|uniref:uncharacterized protein LOC135715349 n=1 Tax=Ochlerotatus camptorhynchus TaxID=644619 RepID=UPI0031D65988